MDFKVGIKCMKCRCSFELRPESFKIRDSLECPNCGQMFPKDVYEKLKAGVTALGEVPEQLPEDSDCLSLPAEGFSLQVSEYSDIADVMHTKN